MRRPVLELVDLLKKPPLVPQEARLLPEQVQPLEQLVLLAELLQVVQ